MKKEAEDYVNGFCERMRIRFNQNEKVKKTHIEKNVLRKISLTMASICEDAVASLVADILDKKYKILVDMYLSYVDNGKNKRYRPDIVIFKTIYKGDKKINEIVGIVEVKAQMGYCGVLEFKEFEVKLNELNGKIEFSKEDYELLSDEEKNFYKDLDIEGAKETAKFVVSEMAKIYVVNVFNRIHHNNVIGTIKSFKNKPNDRAKFYTFFHENDKNQEIWYHELSNECLFETSTSKKLIDQISDEEKLTHGLSQFINDIREIAKNN